jgi:pimeloyl-ACP methyl ester carboxylesterase
LVLVTAAVLAACTSSLPAAHVGATSEPGASGELTSCGTLHPGKPIDPRAPLVVLVHGCNASQGRFSALADLFELHGQQTLCFRYDDRRRVGEVAEELLSALARLAERRERTDLTVLGHSQGGLVARTALALSAARPLDTLRGHLQMSLVTVSAPFNGIDAAADCGSRWLHAITFGATLAICRAIAGPKWRDIHPHARLVERPEPLAVRVVSHLEVRTDERNTCRARRPDGRCGEDDYVFSIREQENAKVDHDQRVRRDTVAAGHAEIVGGDDAPPRKLLSVLQRHGVLNATPADKQGELQALLERLF